MMRLSLPANLLIGVCLVATGCSGGSGPAVHYVEGIVKLDGQPVEGVNVTFAPVNSTDGVGATGITDANGVYKLTAIPNGTPQGGAAAGDYNVALSKVTSTGGNTVTSSEDPNYGKAPSSGKTEPIKIQHVIPEKYNNPATSGLKVTVKPGSNKGEEFTFNLTKS